MKLFDYIKGSRKGRDAHRVELDAMRDPLLRDAIEGFDSVDGNHELVVDKLRAKISAQAGERAFRPRRRRNTGWSIAASLLLCASIGGLYLLSEAVADEPFTLSAKVDMDDLYRTMDGVHVLSRKTSYLNHGTFDHIPDVFADNGIPNIALASVVVTDNRTDKTDLIRFNKYIAKNLIPVKDKDGEEIKGQVELEFSIDSNGRPYEIWIVKNLSDDADKKATRLLENGPQWSFAKDRRTVTVEF